MKKQAVQRRHQEEAAMPEIVPEDFSTALLCMYFALAREGELPADRPRVYFSRSQKDSRAWGDLFRLDRKTQVWMCRDLGRTLTDLDVSVSGDYQRKYGQLKPDVWIQDGQHAIIIENKDGGHRSRREDEYLEFLHENVLGPRMRAFLYSVPQSWLAGEEARCEWWRFVKEGEADQRVPRGIIPWDNEFVTGLCGALSVPEWFRDKLPDKVDERRYLDPGQHFWR
jgi:hypothetical protein